MTRNRRSPAEIIAAMEAKLAMAKAKLEGRAIVTDPSSPAAAAMETLNAEEAVLRKDLSNGTQGCEYRIRLHELWIAEIQARQAYAKARLPEVLAIKEEIRAAAANGSNEVPSTANRFETARLQHAFATAEALRKANTAQRKASKEATDDDYTGADNVETLVPLAEEI